MHPEVLILGGGVAGLATAQRILNHQPEAQIEIVDRGDSFKTNIQPVVLQSVVERLGVQLAPAHPTFSSVQLHGVDLTTAHILREMAERSALAQDPGTIIGIAELHQQLRAKVEGNADWTEGSLAGVDVDPETGRIVKVTIKQSTGELQEYNPGLVVDATGHQANVWKSLPREMREGQELREAQPSTIFSGIGYADPEILANFSGGRTEQIHIGPLGRGLFLAMPPVRNSQTLLDPRSTKRALLFLVEGDSSLLEQAIDESGWNGKGKVAEQFNSLLRSKLSDGAWAPIWHSVEQNGGVEGVLKRPFYEAIVRQSPSPNLLLLGDAAYVSNPLEGMGLRNMAIQLDILNTMLDKHHTDWQRLSSEFAWLQFTQLSEMLQFSQVLYELAELVLFRGDLMAGITYYKENRELMEKYFPLEEALPTSRNITRFLIKHAESLLRIYGPMYKFFRLFGES